jgi:RNA polymerase sigma-70 factor (ECF subfamily)
MSNPPDSGFIELIRLVESGSEEAATDLINQYGPSLRRIARVRLHGSEIRRVLDSQDIYQSVMAIFFQRVQTGTFELETPEDLIRLVSTMIRNRVTDKVRRHHAQRRDLRRNLSVEDESIAVVDMEDSPSVLVSRQELIMRFRELLTEQERLLLDERARGYTWQELAERLSATPDQLRKQLSRALEKVARKLDLGEQDDG